MASLPYISTPGNIERALNAIKSAATPRAVSQDFVKTILQITGGSGNEMTAYLRKIGFTNEDGTPSEIYKKFRNTATEGSAVAAALGIAYRPLYVRNEYMHKLPDDKLKGLIVEETGWAADADTVSKTMSCIRQLKKFASWDAPVVTEPAPPPAVKTEVVPSQPTTNPPPPDHPPQQHLRMQLGYTINLNLPATSDVEVFNAIFKSLKEHLLKNSNG